MVKVIYRRQYNAEVTDRHKLKQIKIFNGGILTQYICIFLILGNFENVCVLDSMVMGVDVFVCAILKLPHPSNFLFFLCLFIIIVVVFYYN